VALLSIPRKLRARLSTSTVFGSFNFSRAAFTSAKVKTGASGSKPKARTRKILPSTGFFQKKLNQSA
jgi:hypothetical protein